MIKKLFPLLFLIIAAVIILLIVQPFGLDKEKLSGAAVSAVLWILGLFMLKWGRRQSPIIMLAVVLGGMLFRIFMALLAIFIVMKFTEWELMPFVISLIIFYFACEFALILNQALDSAKQCSDNTSS